MINMCTVGTTGRGSPARVSVVNAEELARVPVPELQQPMQSGVHGPALDR